MPNRFRDAHVIFPHQLFEDAAGLDTGVLIVIVEDDLYFRQYRFHKQKLILHRATMRQFAERLKKEGFTIEYVETSSSKSMKLLERTLRDHAVEHLSYYELVDDWLDQRLNELIATLKLSAARMVTPAFLTTPGELDEYFEHGADRMQSFYEWQRRRLDVLLEDGDPVGGRWSFDDENRKKLPRTITLPESYPYRATKEVTDAVAWVKEEFADNPGTVDGFAYATTHATARRRLEAFVQDRLAQFGPYEDAIAGGESELFHSVLSPYLNIGLLTPREVLDYVITTASERDIPIQSLEGFVRQLIGWREYMRATYVRYGRTMRTKNELQFRRQLGDGWWTGSTGLEPVDITIQRVLKTAYAHHIERLMILGNVMLLERTDPDAVYEWFMSLFVDAYDWVMVPNVYAMSQFSAGTMITTKPYISGSNYVLKMSDHAKGDWTKAWDALYWRFVNDHRAIFAANPRSNMMVSLYDRFDAAKKADITRRSNAWFDR